MLDKKSFKVTYSILLGIIYFLLILTFSIFICLIYRPIYYSLIGILNLTETGYSYYQIKVAFDELMDCLVFNYPFSLGDFTYSLDGMNHFLDCKGLFLLNNVALVISFILFVILEVVRRYFKIEQIKIKGISFYFVIPCIFLCLLVIFVIYALIDFMGAFTFFHSILFPGASNWVFNTRLDPIINVLPYEVFITYGVIIFVIFIGLTILPLILDLRLKRKEKRKKTDEVC